MRGIFKDNLAKANEYPHHEDISPCLYQVVNGLRMGLAKIKINIVMIAKSCTSNELKYWLGLD